MQTNLKSYANLITLEMGKPINESIAEINKCIGLCDYYFEQPQGMLNGNKSWILDKIKLKT